MRVGAHLSLAVVVAALATCSCGQPGMSKTSDAAVPQPSGTAHSADPAPEPETNPIPEVSEAEAYISSDVGVNTVDRNEVNTRFSYDLDIHYPQITNPRTGNQRRFNRYVRRLIETNVNAFRVYCAKNNKQRDGTRRRMEYHLGINYEVFFATTEVLSIKLTLESFTGYLNSDWVPIPINYDLKAGKPLVLRNIFKRRSNFLKVIAAYSVDEFMKRGLNCGGRGVTDEQWMREGAKPKADNYSGWNLARNGILITFGEYQVGAGCLGLVSVVVPYDHLRGTLRRDVERLQLKH